MGNKFSILIVLFITALLLPSVLAVPGFPHSFCGDVFINGGVAPNGTLVSATIDGREVITNAQNPVETLNGTYGKDGLPLLVQGELTNGDTVKFFVNGVDSGETAVFAYGGGPTCIDLSVTITTETPPGPGTTPGGPSGPGTTGGSGAPSTPPADSSEVIRESSYTEQLTNPEDIRELLEGNGLSEEEILGFIQAAENGELEIVRELAVTKTVVSGTTSYESVFTLVIKNTSQNNLRDVKVVETIPKEIAQDASEISSVHNFRVILADPVIEFTIPLLMAGQTIELTYSINENVTQEKFESMPGVLGKGTFAPIDDDGIVCPTVWTPVCGVDGITYSNDCYANAAGIAVAYEGECVTETPTEPVIEQAMDWTPIIIVIIVLLAIIGIAYYKREDIQKMLKK